MLDDLGFVEVGAVLTADQCADLTNALESADGNRVGSRNLLDLKSCRELAVVLKTHAGVGPLLSPTAVAVQCTLFDKSSERNWFVALHQDLSIPVVERVPDPGCIGWSEKGGVTFVQPPVPVLESLVAVRAHLDDCGREAGPLRVVPGSHRHGRLSAEAARAMRDASGEVECIVARGGALAMRPLLLHSSSKARVRSPRRVLHVLFGPRDLPCGLRWHRAV